MLDAFLNVKTRREYRQTKKIIFSARVFPISVNIMKRYYEQFFELEVAKYQVGHVMSSGYNVSGLQLPNKKEATQEWNFASATLLYSVRDFSIMRERMRTFM